MKNTIVTGSEGFIAYHLIKLLNKEETIFIDRNSSHASSFSNPIDINGIYEGCLNKEDEENKAIFFQGEIICEDRFAIQTIYHLAGQTNVLNSIEKPMQDCVDNIFTMLKMIMLFPNAKIIYTQSIASENPISPYGISKRTAEDYLKLLSKNYTICVLPNIYGERGRGVIDIFKASDKLYIRGNGEQTRTYVYAGDIAKGLVKAKDWENGGKYYFGGGDVLSINDLAKTLNKVPEYTEAIEGEIINSLVENTTPDWKPELKVEEYLKI